jgi:hypothetical protein
MTPSLISGCDLDSDQRECGREYALQSRACDAMGPPHRADCVLPEPRLHRYTLCLVYDTLAHLSAFDISGIESACFNCTGRKCSELMQTS